MRHWIARLIVCALPALVCLGVLECAIHVFSRRDADGNVWIRSAHIKPYRLPVKQADQLVAQYLKKDSEPSLDYDPHIGWRLRPGKKNVNAAGFITSGPVPPQERGEKLRIAVFGGSYTQGGFVNGWWRVLENELQAVGIPAEVLNFGVVGYGMDQAYIRWQRDGRLYQPHIVIFGFAAGNCYDNLNMVRLLKDPDTGVPFTKPRFALKDGALRLLNSPTVPVEQIPALIRDPAAWPLSAEDWFWRPGDFRLRWWRASRLAAYAENKLGALTWRDEVTRFYRTDGPGGSLALAIVREFAREVEAAGSRFCIAHLPYSTELEDLRHTGRFEFQQLLEAVSASAPTVHTEHALLQSCGDRPATEFFVDGHYAPGPQKVVGQEIAAFVKVRAAAWRAGHLR
jgi:hypothetical protein